MVVRISITRTQWAAAKVALLKSDEFHGKQVGKGNSNSYFIENNSPDALAIKVLQAARVADRNAKSGIGKQSNHAMSRSLLAIARKLNGASKK